MAGAGKAERTNLSFHDFQRVVTALRPPVEQQTHGQREKERGRAGENGQKRAKEWPPTCHPPPPAATSLCHWAVFTCLAASIGIKVRRPQGLNREKEKKKPTNNVEMRQICFAIGRPAKGATSCSLLCLSSRNSDVPWFTVSPSGPPATLALVCVLDGLPASCAPHFHLALR